MITKYTIIEGNDKDTFINSINSLLERGWELHGGTSITTVVLGNNGVTKYAQALIHKYESQTP